VYLLRPFCATSVKQLTPIVLRRNRYALKQCRRKQQRCREQTRRCHLTACTFLLFEFRERSTIQLLSADCMHALAATVFENITNCRQRHPAAAAATTSRFFREGIPKFNWLVLPPRDSVRQSTRDTRGRAAAAAAALRSVRRSKRSQRASLHRGNAGARARAPFSIYFKKKRPLLSHLLTHREANMVHSTSAKPVASSPTYRASSAAAGTDFAPPTRLSLRRSIAAADGFFAPVQRPSSIGRPSERLVLPIQYSTLADSMSVMNTYRASN
jgi:hypothetical protein